MENRAENVKLASDVVGKQKDAPVVQQHTCWIEPRGSLQARLGRVPKHFDPDRVSYAQILKNFFRNLLRTVNRH